MRHDKNSETFHRHISVSFEISATFDFPISPIMLNALLKIHFYLLARTNLFCLKTYKATAATIEVPFFFK